MVTDSLMAKGNPVGSKFMFGYKSINYTIVSKPAYIRLECPYCYEDIEVPFCDVDYNTDYWGDGGWCDCPKCGFEIELGNWEYD